MALKPLNPAPKILVADGWELLASEAGRSNQGVRATVAISNGEVQAYQTLVLGDLTAQQALVAVFAGVAGVGEGSIAHALPKLAMAVEGVLRHMATQDDADHQSQATRLVALALDAGAELFHTPGADGDAYATIAVEGHKETWPLKVKRFRRWLARLLYQAEDKSPGSQAVQDALGVLEGKALYEGAALAVSTRLAEHHGALYLDLADDQWRAVEVTSSGWRVVTDPPVKFRRARGMLPLPLPVTGGRLGDLKPLVNIATEEDWRLVVSWLVAALRPRGPYPVLVLHGEQGSAKSTLVRVLRALVDPNTAALRTTPRDERDLVIAATNSWLIALDNLSHLSDWLSDALCRLATGSGFATRELYTDAEEAIFAAQRPIVITGFWQRFEHARPQLLGALLDVVSQGLRTLPSVQLERLPRMADFALWACAAADACGWTAQDFLDAYQGVREAAYDLTLEASPVAPLVRELLAQHGQWEGTASEFLTALERLAAGGRAPQGTLKVGSDVTTQKAWPKNGRALSNALRRLAPTLRAVGVAVTFDVRQGQKRTRLIQLSAIAPPGGAGQAASGPAGTGRAQGTIEKR